MTQEVVVRTGEEDEIKLFGKRVVLFRYDKYEHEWKERGVGELKLLSHAANGTYRLLMRREQVFRLVLNHRIYSHTVVSQKENNPKVYIWAAPNFVDDIELGAVENFAARFQTVEHAMEFRCKLDECFGNSFQEVRLEED